MKNAFAAIDCQIGAILGHVVHNGSLDLACNVRHEFLAAYWALDEVVKSSQPPEAPAAAVPLDDPPRGLLDALSNGAA